MFGWPDTTENFISSFLAFHPFFHRFWDFGHAFTWPINLIVQTFLSSTMTPLIPHPCAPPFISTFRQHNIPLISLLRALLQIALTQFPQTSHHHVTTFSNINTVPVLFIRNGANAATPTPFVPPNLNGFTTFAPPSSTQQCEQPQAEPKLIDKERIRGAPRGRGSCQGQSLGDTRLKRCGQPRGSEDGSL